MREMTKSEKVSESLMGKLGAESRRWKGSKASYVAKHMWIIKHYGNAKMCSIDPTHRAKRYEWANISGKHIRDISDYMELCPSCHRKMDMNKTHCVHGHEYTQENTFINANGARECQICRKERRKRYASN